MQTNPCIRCGKERLDGEVWTEMLGQILVTHTQTICPDSACQKIVDADIAAQREKRELLASKKKAGFRQQPADNKPIAKPA